MSYRWAVAGTCAAGLDHGHVAAVEGIAVVARIDVDLRTPGSTSGPEDRLKVTATSAAGMRLTGGVGDHVGGGEDVVACQQQRARSPS